MSRKRNSPRRHDENGANGEQDDAGDDQPDARVRAHRRARERHLKTLLAALFLTVTLSLAGRLPRATVTESG